MFHDDLILVQEAITKHGPVAGPFVEVGGLEDPTIAKYDVTISWMKSYASRAAGPPSAKEIEWAQHARYQRIHRPLDAALPGYICEDPGTGGCSIENLADKYPRACGAIVALSVLEHCAAPWFAEEDLHKAARPGCLLIVSVPFQFPHHPSPEDNFRFSPTGLRKLFEGEFWDVLECDWRLRIPADAGVLDIHTMRPQAIESCALIARAR